MPNRILKESIKFSNQIDALSWFEEVLFYRLIVTADDYGCADGRTVVLKNSLFPTKDTVTKKAVEDAIDHLVSVGLLYRYSDTASGTPYLFFPTWEKHQRVRNQHRKYPEPPPIEQLNTGCQSLDSNSLSNDSQMTTSCQSESNPIRIQSESNPNPNAHGRVSEIDAMFERFWSEYPRHDTKAEARKVFGKLKPDEGLLETMLTAIRQQKGNWSDPKFIPQPRTWLNQRRWEDEPVKSSPKGTVSAQQYTQREYPKDDNDGFDWLREMVAKEGSA